MLSSIACQSPEEVVEPSGATAANLAAAVQAEHLIELQAGEFLQLDVDQRGADVAVALEDPSGKRLVLIDGLSGAAGSEQLLWIAKTTGSYRVEISAPTEDGYEVHWEPPRQATPEDRLRAAAAMSFYRGGSRILDGQLDAAAPEYRRSLEQWTELGAAEWRAASLFALGYIASMSEDLDTSLDYFRQASQLAESFPLQLRIRSNIGRDYLDRDELELARTYLTEALQGWRTLEDRWWRATTASNLGLVHSYLREVGPALELYGEALALWRELGDRSAEAVTLQNRGRAFAAQGKTDRAIEDLEASLAICEEIGYPRGMAIALTSLGQVHRDLGRLDDAMTRFERALDLRSTNEPRGRAVTLVGIGEVHYDRQELDKARELFEEALTIFREAGDRRNEASVLLNLGLLHDTADPQAAIGFYEQAIDFFRVAGDRDFEAACLLGFARAERSRGALDRAREHAEAAIELVEELRRQPPGLELRSAYFATKQNYYDFYIDLLMELADQRSDPSYAAEALTASERARARSQMEAIVEGGSGPSEDDELARREAELRRAIVAKQYQITESVVKDADPERVAELKRQARVLIDQLDAVRGRLRLSHPLYAQIKDPQPLSARQIQQQVLDGDAMLLEYQLGEAGSYLWSVTSDSLDVFELPPQGEIEERASRATALLGASNREEYFHDLQATLSELSDTLLGPVAGLLGGQRLLIVAEGAVQYLPFGALPSPGDSGEAPRPLVADHEITSLPSASWLYYLRERYRNREAPSRDVAIFADPVFRPAGDDGSSEPPTARGEQLPGRLFYSGLEAKTILELAENRQNLEALRFDAVKERAMSGELRDYRYVHIATHGMLDPEFPEQSSLVFSLYDEDGNPRDGFMLTHEIYQLDLLADLVVLSACQTAHGRKVRGEGLTGWTQGFMYSGAKRVVVSLWQVDDEATAELMEQFYTFLFRHRMSPASALRRAQDAVRQRPQWRAPYFWAAFILQGEFQ